MNSPSDTLGFDRTGAAPVDPAAAGASRTPASGNAVDAHDSAARPTADSVAARSERGSATAPDPPRPSTPAGPLPQLDGYEIIECVGRGGMGVVYEGYQLSTGRRVAIKFMHDFGRNAEAARRRFEREVDLVARLSHPNIVSLLDSGVNSGRYYYVMEYVEGRPLDQWFLDAGAGRRAHPTGPGAPVGRAERRPGAPHGLPATIADLLRIFCKVCDAVEFAHQRGVLHRDLKPSNVLVDERGEPRLLDFGLAKAIDPQSGEWRDLTLSEPGQLIGTLGYMSPEQARGDVKQISVRSDVYSLGALLYELLTGRLPCPLDGPVSQVLERIVEHDPPALSRFLPTCPKDLNAIVLMALAKEPSRRYATVGELATEIRRHLADEPVVARPPSRGDRLLRWIRRNRAVTAVGGAALLILLVVGVTAAVRIAIEQRQKLANLELARDKLRAVLNEYEHAVFDTNATLGDVLGTQEVRDNLINVALEFYSTLPRDAALLGLEELAGPHYGKLGDALAERGDLARAQRFYELSLSSARAACSADPGDPSRQRALARAMQRRASIEPDPEQALAQLEEAVGVLRRIDASQAADFESRRALADGVLRVAEQLSRIGKTDEFRRVAREALALGADLARAAPAEPARAVEVSRFRRSVADEAHYAGAWDVFREAADQCLSFAREIAATWPTNPVVQFESLQVLGLCAQHLVTQGELDAAQGLLAEARRRADAVLQADPRNLKLKLAAADIYAISGDEAKRRQLWSDAIDWYERSNAIVLPAFELQPNEKPYRRRYVASLVNLAGIHREAGNPDAAVGLYEAYLAKSEPLFAEDVVEAPLRAFAWHAIGSQVAARDAGRARACFAHGLDELDRYARRQPLNDFERELRETLTAALAAAEPPGPAGP